jgi:hypothetical protein
MKHLLLLLLGLSMAGTASAQTVSGLELPTAKIADDRSWSITANADRAPASPQGENVTLTYWDPNGTLAPWQAAWQPDPNNANFVVLGYGQRFTLPTETGFLDSLHIQIMQVVEDVSGGAFNIFITKDEIVPSQKGGPDQHLPVLTTDGVISSAGVPAAVFQGATNVNLTLKTDHVEVPKEFFVFMTPAVIGNTYSCRFVIPGETKTGVATTTENSRSVIFYRNGATPFLEVMDNFFQVSGQNVAVNFGIDAFVDVEAGSVARTSTSAATMFPNPVASSGTLNIQHNEQINSIRIVNMLGNEMQSWSGKSTNVKLSTSDLAKGIYNVIVNTENGVTTEKLIVN